MNHTHTPGPFKVYNEASETYVLLVKTNDLKPRALCRVFHLNPEQRRVDAEFIATACSNHDALVELVQALVAPAVLDSTFANARKLLKAIAK